MPSTPEPNDAPGPDPLLRLEQRLLAWAQERDDIVGMVIVGSRARREQPADQWSDLDVGIVTTHPRRYRDRSEWIAQIAEPRVVVRDPEGITWHVLFADGAEAGIAPIGTRAVHLLRPLLGLPIGSRWLTPVIPSALRTRHAALTSEIAEYTGRGIRILLDESGILGRVQALLPPRAPGALPGADDFEDAVLDFWFKSVWTAKHLRRGELWYARSIGLDGRMRARLLLMLTWHARATRPGVDTWRDGHYLEQWMDAEWADALPGTFGGDDADGLWDALDATTELFREVATRTAALLSHPYPHDADAFATDAVRAIRPDPAPDARPGG